MPRKSAKPVSEEVYEIKTIHKYEQRADGDYYLVEWAGYPMEEATWEPRSHFYNPSAEVLRRMQELKSEQLRPGAAAPAKGVKRKVRVSEAPTPTKRRAKEPKAAAVEVPSPKRGRRKSSGASAAPRPPIRVKSIRQDPVHGLCAILIVPERDDATTNVRRPIDEVRAEYPDELIEFLLDRIQFRVTANRTSTSTSSKESA